MAQNNARIPTRARAGPLRVKTNVDENAVSRHSRNSSSTAIPGLRNVSTFKSGPHRSALGEVVSAHSNRLDIKSKRDPKDKDESEPDLKRRIVSTASGPQKILAGPIGIRPRSTTQTILARVQRPSSLLSKRDSRVTQSTLIIAVDEEAAEESSNAMDIVPPTDEMEAESDLDAQQAHQDLLEVEQNTSEVDEEDDIDTTKTVAQKSDRVWPDLPTVLSTRYQREVQAVKESFVDDVDVFDTTMVSEYSEDIFKYMEELEASIMPNGDYMSGQNEITWSMRQTLVDWLLQVHLRYHMLPETLWIAVNIVDRFLTKRVVSLIKLQLVGVTAMFIAAKYEEILAPSVEEFVFMTENGYSKEEILKGERIVLQTLDFKISHYCSPYSWMRKISKADDYDIQTRTLSKFLTEVTLLDHRFLRVKPSLVAAVGMYCARKMLGGDWCSAFIFYSGYPEEELLPGHQWLLEKLTEENFQRQYVCKKYANKKFLKASLFAIEWARVNVSGDGKVHGAMLIE